jgi:hypothetical protein
MGAEGVISTVVRMTDSPSPPDRWWCSSCKAENLGGERTCRWCGRLYAGPLHSGDTGAIDELWSATRPVDDDAPRAAPAAASPPVEPPPPEGAPPPEWVRPPDDSSSTAVMPAAAVPSDRTGPPAPPYDVGREGGPYDDEPRRSVPWLALAALMAVIAVAAGVVALVAANRDDDGSETEGSVPPSEPSVATTAPATDASADPTTSPSTDPATTVPATTATTVTETTTEFSLPPSPTTTVPVTEPATTVTTAPPSPGVPPNETAQRDLNRLIEQDFATVEALEGTWVVQLSAKRPGVEADGITYQFTDVLDNHQQLRDDYGAVLLSSNDWVYETSDLFITIVPTSYDDAAGALDECGRLGIDRENCLAKKITTDRSDPNTVEYQNG